jgi:hypothetical protein
MVSEEDSADTANACERGIQRLGRDASSLAGCLGPAQTHPLTRKCK